MISWISVLFVFRPKFCHATAGLLKFALESNRRSSFSLQLNRPHKFTFCLKSIECRDSKQKWNYLLIVASIINQMLHLGQTVEALPLFLRWQIISNIIYYIISYYIISEVPECRQIAKASCVQWIKSDGEPICICIVLLKYAYSNSSNIGKKKYLITNNRFFLFCFFFS